MTPNKNSSIDQEKYLNALAYFIKECDGEKLGLVKLNKLFYYLDFISYRDTQNSVTGETYVHLPKGPLASSLEDIINIAKKEKLIEHKEDHSEKYGKRNRYKALKSPNMKVFNPYEEELLAYLCSTFKEWKTDEMVAQAHCEAPWVFSKPKQKLDYKNSDDIEFFSEVPDETVQA